MSTLYFSKTVIVNFGSKANKHWVTSDRLSIGEIAQQLRVNQYRKVITVLMDGQELSGKAFYSLLRKHGIAYKFDIDESIRYGNALRTGIVSK
jgi:hypothetical protein